MGKQQEETIQGMFHEAVQTLKAGQREKARELLRQVLLENPNHARAWLWMSGLVEKREQQKECLERALELEPGCEPAIKGLDFLRLQEFIEEMPAKGFPPAPTDPGQRRARKLGEYLIERGLLSVAQLDYALSEQQKLQRGMQGIRVPLGDVLIKLDLLTPKMLASALIEQQQEKIESATGTPEYLGEYLVAQGIITREQLSVVLAAQIQFRKQGRKMLLGELLIRAGYVSPSVLETVLEQQRADIFRRFEGDFDDFDEEASGEGQEKDR